MNIATYYRVEKYQIVYPRLWDQNLVVLLAMLLAISSPAKAGGISRRLINIATYYRVEKYQIVYPRLWDQNLHKVGVRKI